MSATYFLFLFLNFVHAQSSGLEFLEAGKPLLKEEPTQIKNRVTEQTWKVYEPQEASLKNYRGFPVEPLLQNVYGPRLNQYDAVSFYCVDGYRADIPLKEFREKKSLLAYAMADASAFSLKTSGGVIPLAPYYLVWDHPTAASAKKDVYRWPYAVSQVEPIDSKTAYQPLEVQDPQLKKSRDHFVQHCFSCHALNGAGGRRGPPLNAFFMTQKEEDLIKYILNPKSVNKESKMSGLSKNLKDRKKIARGIVLYGKKIAR